MKTLSSPSQRVQLSHLGLLQITGARAAEFLQGQVSCDVREINTEQSRLGLHCDAKGRVQASFRLFYTQETFYALLPRTMVPILRECLQKYAIFSAVQLTDISSHWQFNGFIYPEKADPSIQPWITTANAVQADASHFMLGVLGKIPRVISITPCANPSPFVEQYATEGTLEEWLLHDIHAGIAVIYPEIVGQYTPQQLNYTAIGAVSFKKGCYIGQEIIARTHYLGKVKYGLHHVTFTTDTPLTTPGTVIYNEQNNAQGALIQCAQTTSGAYEALVCLQNSAICHTLFLDHVHGPRLTLRP
jgi:tRNA-modifying protein YgfZ